MGRLLAICLIALLVWVAVELYEKGLENAWGGVLGSVDGVQRASAASRRAADAFQRAYDTSENRVDRLLEE